MFYKISKKFLVLFVICFLSVGLQASDENKKIKIDIVSDVVCPWCAVGYKRLSTAIKELNMQDKVELVWHPFELNPNMPQEGKNADEYLMAKLGLNQKELEEKRKRVAKTGQESGFKFNYFKDMRKPNTFYAHVLLNYAKEFGKQTQLKVRLQEAYFSEQKNIGNKDVLYKELQAVGLNANEAMKILEDKSTIQKVRDEEIYWRNIRGVFAVPTMIFNDDIVRRGAHSVDRYKRLLLQLSNTK